MRRANTALGADLQIPEAGWAKQEPQARGIRDRDASRLANCAHLLQAIGLPLLSQLLPFRCLVDGPLQRTETLLHALPLRALHEARQQIAHLGVVVLHRQAQQAQLFPDVQFLAFPPHPPQQVLLQPLVQHLLDGRALLQEDRVQPPLQLPLEPRALRLAAGQAPLEQQRVEELQRPRHEVASLGTEAPNRLPAEGQALPTIDVARRALQDLRRSY
eukprot:CAMPEP_0176175028 /NCGR_PEP_ID=MMETSP0120_2-20121206/89667_1 /TAXON_ID=160619 /ORGANISM="Kryptoperidinium foliaceum, Strain CCMP 1326" /LENGTH=215 /DNA_ID=CAMNT_0017513067 /DNA_START=97 /DNA_END=741 /DNA_ORIENTATION=+